MGYRVEPCSETGTILPGHPRAAIGAVGLVVHLEVTPTRLQEGLDVRGEYLNEAFRGSWLSSWQGTQ